jgi:hypothetical protein
VALRGEVVYLAWPDVLDQPDEAGCICHISIMKKKSPLWLVRILIQVIDAIRIQRRAPALNSMNFVSFFEQ